VALMLLRVRVHLLTTAEGGRSGPIQSEYRPDWDLSGRGPDGQILYHMGRLLRLPTEPLVPGAECDADLEPFRSEDWTHVVVGDRLNFFEGARLVGYARVIAIDG
jgi:hypothetical protein